VTVECMLYFCRCSTKYDGHTVLRNARSDSTIVGCLSSTECGDVWSADTNARHAGHSTASNDEIPVSDTFCHTPATAAGWTYCHCLTYCCTWLVYVTYHDQHIHTHTRCSTWSVYCQRHTHTAMPDWYYMEFILTDNDFDTKSIVLSESGENVERSQSWSRLGLTNRSLGLRRERVVNVCGTSDNVMGM